MISTLKDLHPQGSCRLVWDMNTLVALNQRINCGEKDTGAKEGNKERAESQESFLEEGVLELILRDRRM